MPSLSSLRQIIRDSSLPTFILNAMLDLGIPFEPQDKTEDNTKKTGCEHFKHLLFSLDIKKDNKKHPDTLHRLHI